MDDAAAGTEQKTTEETDLSPLTPRPGPRSARARRSVAALVVVAVAAAVSLLVTNLLGDASLFFYNADEAVERRDELAGKRFTLQGTPVDRAGGHLLPRPAGAGLPVSASTAWLWMSSTPAIRPSCFSPEFRSSSKGAWRLGPGPGPVIADDGWHFASDRMLVKHDNDYRERDNYDRAHQAKPRKAARSHVIALGRLPAPRRR